MKQKKWQVVALAVLLLITMLAAPITAAPGQGAERADYLVGFHGSPNPGLIKAFGGEVNAEYQLVDVIAASLPEQALKGLRNHPAVSYVEEDAQVFALGQEVPWGIDKVFDGETNRANTWEGSIGEGITVAVLDTGIAVHPDLLIAGGRRFTMVTTGPPSKRGLLEDDKYHDGHGHGTHVAGTIGALNNDIGVVGVAPLAKLYAVKVLDDSGSGSISAIIAGIQWAVQNNLSIINMSLGGSVYSKSFDDACQEAYDKGVLIISSAGNSGNDDGTGDTVGFPAKYPSVIAVAASDIDDQRASFSSTGPAVELIAPGVSVKSTVPGDQYASYSGTSMASPHVAGVAALVWAANPDLNNENVRSILSETVEKLGIIPQEHQGYGLVRADLAVAAVEGEITPEPKWTLIVETVGKGTTTPVVGSHSYDNETEVKLTATPEDGWTFDKWQITGQDDENQNSITIIMNDNKTVTAVFSEDNDSPGPTGLQVLIKEPLNNASYKYNEWVNIRVDTNDQNGYAVPDSSVTVTVEDPEGSTMATFTGNTDADGIFTTSYRVANKSPTGDYSIRARAVKGSLGPVEAAAVIFEVAGR